MRNLRGARTHHVSRRFRGLEEVALGGYVCGSLARHIPAAATVSLRAPPPLERELDIVPIDNGVELRDGEIVIADATPADLQNQLELPAPVPLDAAGQASALFPFKTHHPRPSCVVCSPARTDGLRIFPGPVAGTDLVAAVWEPDRSLPTDDNAIATEVVWSALDCPTYFGGAPHGGIDSVLARLTAHMLAPARTGERYVIASWPISSQGRKRLAGAAIWSADSEPCALGQGLWIELRAPTSA